MSSSTGTPVRSADLREGDAAERRESLERRRVEEVERDLAAPDGGAEAVERDARLHEAHHEPGGSVRSRPA